MKFIDEANIKVEAGHGGPGCRSFRREKFIPFGGPDGGDGGHGGSVILRADPSSHTLLDFKFQPQWKADDGKGGEGSGRTGKSGSDLIVKVPVGTQILEKESGNLVCDLNEPSQEFIIAAGGRGGKGNEFFKTATNQVPEHTQPGEPGAVGEFLLSLKLVADVGLIGLPNAGKSTLISRISAAKPKIADYPFTTLVPNLGVVKSKSGRTFVVADIPGLIPGASEGKGLGIKFLKHVERTKVLAHLIDPTPQDVEGNSVDAVKSFDDINGELQAFSDEFASRPQVIVITKIDAFPDKKTLEDLMAKFAERGLPCLALSSASGKGIPDFIEYLVKVIES